MKKILLSCFTLLLTLFGFAQNEFITTWKTDNPGTSNSTSITIPTFFGETYNYDVDWNNDGNYDLVDIGYTGNATFDFGTPGTYTIRIRGTFPRIYFNNGGDKDKLLSIDQWGNIVWSSFENAFFGASNLAGNASDAPNLSNVTSLRRMFSNCPSFNQNIGNWNVSTITDFSSMLGAATSFNQDIGSWDVSSGTNFAGMFFEAVVFNQDISNWNTVNATNMSNMFNSAFAFDQDIGSWNVETVQNFNLMFNMAGLSTGNYDNLLIGWDSQNLNANLTLDAGSSTYCSPQAIAARTNLINSDGWIIIDAGQDCSYLFITTWQTNLPGLTNSTSITIPTFSGETYNYDVDWENDGIFDDLGVTGNIVHDYGVVGIYTVAIRGTFPRISHASSGGDNRKIISVDQWGTNPWTSMVRAFNRCENLSINATDTPDLSNVLSMDSMFLNATSMNDNIDNWDTSNVTEMKLLFDGATSFNQDLSNWDTSNVQNMNAMFSGATSFNGDISTWNVSNVTDMNFMFAFASSFNQDLTNWDTSNVTNMNTMFAFATAFNGDVSNWNTSSITGAGLAGMFFGATSFDQNLGSWNVEGATDLDFMFDGVTLSSPNYDAILIGWEAQNLQPNVTFQAGSSQYCSIAAQNARNNMINSDGWTINDGGACPTLSIDDIELSQVKLFPNPSNSTVHITGFDISESRVIIHDVSGKQVYSNINYRKDSAIDISGFNSGIYFVNIEIDNSVTTIKLVKT
ncbi:BspA family leucine-rich repeat surface protein [Winogradskyella tangerina]|uniref:BspA family leucine-rich repeat surface protein n=1 Tax=Winogradskyella tangerina TaxID=2023240 RepID=UPI000DBE06EB|nr:BspA family leucine-rich repeat surface protein [Winogradskyella tangerina]